VSKRFGDDLFWGMVARVLATGFRIEYDNNTKDVEGRKLRDLLSLFDCEGEEGERRRS
jgi:hypothetical protein